MTTLKRRGGEPRAADTATPPRNDVPFSRVVRHNEDDRGVFYIVACTCSWVSREYDGPDGGEYAKALHDMTHADEIAAAIRPDRGRP